MFTRLRWLGVGAVAGFGGSMWLRRRVRKVADRLAPTEALGEVRRRVGGIGTDLRASIEEGRVAMAEREAELRRRLPDTTSTAAVLTVAPSGDAARDGVVPPS